MDPLAAIAAEVQACRACPLWKGTTQAVPGEGSGESGIFFLGEAPGFHEDQQGRPFVGAAGQLLAELLAGIGLDRSKVFITNVVRHRPPGNRDPLPDEVAACDIWLRRHLDALQPRVLVTLGRHAMGKFFPGESISRIHGKPRVVGGVTVFPMFHPAAALRQPSLRPSLMADFTALAIFLATTPAVADEPAPPADQMTLFGR
ncbi:MAG: uracil-DNA glycosylase [Chloroflexi bacterium RIFCSPLOWO2_02_FULL_71_16]|nr:MAG: uracil-DNA glycosylase [Chloroflexi bacterium RIFCSPLOWO2_02_FULL_71_16]